MSRIWQALRQAEQERTRKSNEQEVSDIEKMEHALRLRRERTRNDPGSDRRKGLRHSHETTLLIYGSDAEKQPFHEESDTIDANDEGCLFLLATGVSPGQRLFLTNMRNQAEQECRVIYVGRKAQGKVRIGVEFTRPAPQFWRRA
jgi:hypothetical protein